MAGLISTVADQSKNTLNNAVATQPLSQPAPAEPLIAPESPDKPKGMINTLPPAAPAVAPAAPQMRDISRKETVAGQLNDLLNENSTYMQSAKGNAMMQANSRGLLNSSLAVQAGQKAAIDAAMPIAQQDANTFSASGLSAQNAGQDITKMGYQGDINKEAAATKFGYDKDINTQNIEANKALSTQEATQKMAQLDKQLASTEGIEKTRIQAEKDNLQKQIDATTARDSAAVQANRDAAAQAADVQTKRDSAVHGFDMEKLTQSMSSSDRNAFTSAIAPIMQQTQAEISQIQRTPDSQMDPATKTKRITELQQQMQDDIQSMTSLYGYKVGWTSTGAIQTYGQNDTKPKGLLDTAPVTQTTQQTPTTPAPVYESDPSSFDHELSIAEYNALTPYARKRYETWQNRNTGA